MSDQPQAARLTEGCYIAEKVEPLHKGPVSLNKPGEIICRMAEDTGWLPVVVHADTVAQFGDCTLREALDKLNTWPASHLVLEPPAGADGSCTDQCCHIDVKWCFIGWKVIVSDASQRLVYIIKKFDNTRFCWVGAWPD